MEDECSNIVDVDDEASHVAYTVDLDPVQTNITELNKIALIPQ